MLYKAFIREFKSPIVLFCLFGLGPIFRNLWLYSLLCIYSWLHISIIAYIFIFVTFFRRVVDGSALSTMVDYLFLVGLTAAHFVIALHVFLARDKHIRLLESFAEVDALFQVKLNHTAGYANERCSIYARILFVAQKIHDCCSDWQMTAYISTYIHTW